MFTKRLQEIASLYIKDGEVIKARLDIDTSKEGILKACSDKKKVIIQDGNTINCYFKQEDRWIIMDIRNELLKHFSVDIIDNIEFK